MKNTRPSNGMLIENEQAESAIDSVRQAEELRDILHNPAVQATIWALLRSIPVIGELLSGTIAACLNESQRKKREQLLAFIFSEPGKITSQMVNDIDFIRHFARTVEAVDQLTTNDKIAYFAGLLKNSHLTGDPIDPDEYDEFFTSLCRLSFRQIDLLCLLYRYEHTAGEKPNETQLERLTRFWPAFAQEAEERYSLSKEELTGFLTGLSGSGFCKEITGGYLSYSGGGFYTTAYFQRFAARICGEGRENGNMNIMIRPMEEKDVAMLHEGFIAQGWEKPIEILEKYLNEQRQGKRMVLVAELDGHAAGYATLLPNDPHGPFANRNIPTVNDFNVFEPYQAHGLGTAILDAVEQEAAKTSDLICLGVGLHPGYGPAQRLYIKRGYVPDGSGIWYQDKPLPQNAPCKNDDDLVLYMSKKLR